MESPGVPGAGASPQETRTGCETDTRREVRASSLQRRSLCDADARRLGRDEHLPLAFRCIQLFRDVRLRPPLPRPASRRVKTPSSSAHRKRDARGGEKERRR
ncbi:hypothetical protein MTO96_027482 [Rhipicephalus appendiculatus]